MSSNECLINNQQYYILFLNNNVNLYMYHHIYPYPLLPIPINTFQSINPTFHFNLKCSRFILAFNPFILGL